MPLDHFNASNRETFPNRYWVNATYYEPGGPVFRASFVLLPGMLLLMDQQSLTLESRTLNRCSRTTSK
jgi:hypothetical protein